MDTSTVAVGIEKIRRRKGPRRLRTLEEKLRIVAEANAPGTSVAEVARRHGLNANLIFSWRRQHQYGVLEQHTRGPAAKLLPVQVSEAAKSDGEVPPKPGGLHEPGQQHDGPRAIDSLREEGRIEITLAKDIRIAIMGSVAVERIERVLTMLRRLP